MNKILYRSGKFYALRLPERPIYPSANQDTERAWRRYESDLKYYNQQVESLKANSPEIVNPEIAIPECDQCDGCGWYEGGPTLKTTCISCGCTGLRPESYNKIQDGDIFPLPSNMRFEEEEYCTDDGKLCDDQCKDCPFDARKIARLVKTETKEVPKPEPEESQTELWLLAREFMKVISPNGIPVISMDEKSLKENFTIQRKKQ